MDFVSSQNYTGIFIPNQKKKDPLALFKELYNTTFAHRAEFKCHFLVENRDLCYCDDWNYQCLYVSKILLYDSTVVFQQRQAIE